MLTQPEGKTAMITSSKRVAATAAAATLILVGAAGIMYVLRFLFLTH